MKTLSHVKDFFITDEILKANITTRQLVVVITKSFTPTRWEWQKPSINFKVTYNDTLLSSFVRQQFRDFRDLSSYRPRWMSKKPDSPFEHLLHNFVRSLSPRRKLIETSLTNVKDGDDVVVAIAKELFAAMDTEVSHELLRKLNAGDVRAVLQTQVNPNAAKYTQNSDLFFRDYIATSFLRKYEGFDVGEDRIANAMSVWVKAERRCKSTNERFYNMDFSKDELQFLYAVRQKIQNILGACPSITKLSDHLRFGPGTTLGISSKYTSILDKLERSQYAGNGMRRILPRLLQLRPELKGLEPVYGAVPYAAFVPKKWDVDRDIEIPVDYDVLLQLALGHEIRQRLRAFGLDLNNQAEANGLLAQFGSITGSISTIDLKAASNTIAYRLVEFLLPKGWFNLLNACRARSVDFKEINHRHVNQKFSAMGNGYTFELESLIFLAVTLVACGSHHKRKLPNYIGVFGDDICCPSIDASDVIKGLELCGFETNIEKTFITGPFRESCGQDFFLGAPVRPYFQKKKVTDVTQLFTMANGVRRCSVRSTVYYASDVRFAELWQNIVLRIPEQLRVFGPYELGDSVIWSNPSDAITGYWPVSVKGCWSYKSGPFSAEGRGINYYAYSGGTLISAWGLLKSGLASKPYEHSGSLTDFNRFFSKTVTKQKVSIEDLGHIADATTLPANHRECRRHLRYYRSSLTPSLKFDCPAFV